MRQSYAEDVVVPVSKTEIEICYGCAPYTSSEGLAFWHLQYETTRFFVYIDNTDTVRIQTKKNTTIPTNTIITILKRACEVSTQVQDACYELMNVNTVVHTMNTKDKLEHAVKMLYYLRKAQEQVHKRDALQHLDNIIVSGNTTIQMLREHFMRHRYTTIDEFLYKYRPEIQQTFEPQESVLRLFASKGLLTRAWTGDMKSYSLRDYNLTNKTFSKGEVDILDTCTYEMCADTAVKDSGDKSDLTCVNPSEKIVLATTSKNYRDYSGKGKLFDLEKIKSDFDRYYKMDGYTLKTLVVVRDKRELFECMNRMAFSSAISKHMLEESLFLDWNDLNAMYRTFIGVSDVYFDLHVERLMCKYITPKYKQALEQTYPTLKHYTQTELQEQYADTDDMQFIDIMLHGQYTDQVIHNIVNGDQFTDRSGKRVQRVHIKTHNSFAHSLKQLVGCDSFETTTDGVFRCKGAEIRFRSTERSASEESVYNKYNDLLIDVADFVTLEGSSTARGWVLGPVA